MVKVVFTCSSFKSLSPDLLSAVDMVSMLHMVHLDLPICQRPFQALSSISQNFRLAKTLELHNTPESLAVPGGEFL